MFRLVFSTIKQVHIGLGFTLTENEIDSQDNDDTMCHHNKLVNQVTISKFGASAGIDARIFLSLRTAL